MFDKNAANSAEVTTVFVYGYSSTKKPFYKEARTKKIEPDRWSLLLNAAVSCGEKLLLMDGQSPVEGEIVKTRLLSGQMFEIEVTLLK
jgi:hypothetical protein